ncbi:MAG TPA: RNA methyltransferase [Ignavibacteriales bacterium]|nr:RNA methyltransferase [Ignavibacteriales bacterium]
MSNSVEKKLIKYNYEEIKKSYKITEKRYKRLFDVLSKRQFDLKIVLENIHDPHNVSAILRSCDAVGVPKVSLLYYIESFPKKIGKKSSSSAGKWVETEKFKSVDECYQNLRENGFKIYATDCSPDAVSLYSLNLTEKIAIVLGNEHRGVSEEAIRKADKRFYIPMFGMVQSLNVSVASAVILYEALRQRLQENKYINCQLTQEEFNILLEKWLKK